jgi:hypothetical protein
LAVLAIVFNTSFGAHLIEKAIRRSSSLPIHAIQIGGMRSNLVSFASARDIALDLKQEEQTVSYKIKQAKIQTLQGLWGMTPVYLLDIQSFSIESPDLAMEGFTGSIPFIKHGMSIDEFSKLGNFRIQTLRLNPYTLTSIDSHIWVQDNIIFLRGFKADSYRGVIRADGTFHQQSGSYVLSARVADLDLSQMQSVGTEFFKKSSGLISGAVEIQSKNKKMMKFSAEFEIGKKGGSLNADLIRPLLKYLPRDQSIALDANFVNTESINFRLARMKIVQVSPNVYMADLKISTSTIPIDLSVKMDIRMDADPIEEIQRLFLKAS